MVHHHHQQQQRQRQQNRRQVKVTCTSRQHNFCFLHIQSKDVFSSVLRDCCQSVSEYMDYNRQLKYHSIQIIYSSIIWILDNLLKKPNKGGKYCLYWAAVRQCYPRLYYFKCNGSRDNGHLSK
jgi:hypothetical protein